MFVSCVLTDLKGSIRLPFAVPRVRSETAYINDKIKPKNRFDLPLRHTKLDLKEPTTKINLMDPLKSSSTKYKAAERT